METTYTLEELNDLFNCVRGILETQKKHLSPEQWCRYYALSEKVQRQYWEQSWKSAGGTDNK